MDGNSFTVGQIVLITDLWEALVFGGTMLNATAVALGKMELGISKCCPTLHSISKENREGISRNFK